MGSIDLLTGLIQNIYFTGNPKRWIMKNILVTGGCGFIGSNFIRYLLSESGFSGRVINVDADLCRKPGKS